MASSKKEMGSTTVRAHRSTAARLGVVLKSLQEHPESVPPSLKAEIGDQEPITGPVLLDALVARAQRELEAPQREPTWQSKLSPARRAERRHGKLTHDFVGLCFRDGADIDEALDELNSEEVLVVAVPEASRESVGGAQALCLLRNSDIEEVAKSSLVKSVVDLPKIGPSIARSQQRHHFPFDLLKEQLDSAFILRESGKRWSGDLISFHPNIFVPTRQALGVLMAKDPSSKTMATDSDVVVARVLYAPGCGFYGYATKVSYHLPMYVEDECDSEYASVNAVRSALVVGTRKAVCLFLGLLSDYGSSVIVHLPFGSKSFDSFWTAEDSLPPRSLLGISLFGTGQGLVADMNAAMSKHRCEQKHLREGFILASTIALNGKKSRIRPTQGIIGSSIEGDVQWWCLDLGSVELEDIGGRETSAIRVICGHGGRLEVFSRLKDLFLHWLSVTPADSDIEHIAAALSSATKTCNHLSRADEREILDIVESRRKPAKQRDDGTETIG